MSEQETTKSGASQLNWDEDLNSEKKPAGGTQNQGEYKKAKYLTFDKPGLYPVRLVGKGVKFLRHWDPFDKQTRIITHKDYQKEDPAWVAGFYPRDTYAIHVFDRNDNNELKVLEKGKTIFEGFGNYKKVNGVSPASTKEAPDFVIEVIWPGGNKRQAEYKVTAKMKVAPLTDQEIETFKTSCSNLEVMYKSTPLDKIKEAWDALPAEKKIKPKKEENEKGDKGAKSSPAPEKSASSKKSEPIAEKVEDTPADGDDLFGDSKDGKDGSPF